MVVVVVVAVAVAVYVVVVVVAATDQTAAQFRGAFEHAMGATPSLKVPTRLLLNGKGLSRTLSHVPLCFLNRSDPPGPNSWTQSLSNVPRGGRSHSDCCCGEVSRWRYCQRSQPQSQN